MTNRRPGRHSERQGRGHAAAYAAGRRNSQRRCGLVLLDAHAHRQTSPPGFGKGKRGMASWRRERAPPTAGNGHRPYATTGRTECSAPCSTRDERQAWTRNRGFEVTAGSAPTWTASTTRVGPRERRATERPASPGCTERGRVEAQKQARKHQPYSLSFPSSRSGRRTGPSSERATTRRRSSRLRRRTIAAAPPP